MPKRKIKFATYLYRNGLTLHLPDGVLWAAEPLQQSKRDFISKIFGTNRIFGIYAPLDDEEIGYGSIVATNLLRLKHPIAHYNTGDICRLISTNPESHTAILELKGRESSTFFICNLFVPVNALQPLLQTFLDWQIVLSINNLVDLMMVKCVPDPRLEGGFDKERLREGLRKVLLQEYDVVAEQFIVDVEVVEISHNLPWITPNL